MTHPTPVYKSAADTHKTIYFTLAIAVNLLGVACLLIAWNAKGINNVSQLQAINSTIDEEAHYCNQTTNINL